MSLKRLFKNHAEKAYDPMLQEKLNEIKGSPIFWNKNSKVYIARTELAGYEYISFLLTGYLEIKTVSGLSLTFYAKNEQFEIRSESEIVEGDYSPVSRIGITTFDTDYDSELLAFLKKEELTKIELKTRNGQIIKQSLVIEYDEWDVAHFCRKLAEERVD